MKKVNCFKCRHYQTTWNPKFPRSCKAYGFKTKEIPSVYVLKASGSPCLEFSPTPKTTEPPPQHNQSTIDIKL